MGLIILVLVCVGIYFLILALKSGSSGSEPPPGDTALEALKKRYARGEIDKEEFDRYKKDLDAG